MRVKRLLELLKDADPELPVFVLVSQEGGTFGFAEACEGETGYTELGPPPEALYSKEGPLFYGTDQMKVFAILPHGFADEQEDDHEPDYLHN